MTGARTGDFVRGVRDDRARTVLEGVLILRLVRPGYLQVAIACENSGPWPVDPSSVEVIERGFLPVGYFDEDGAPERDPGIDLDEAIATGLAQPVRARAGGTWEEMFRCIHVVAEPLMAAGWRLVSTEKEESWEFGDSVFYDLERDGVTIELEYSEQGDLVVYPVEDDGADPDGEPTEPLFSISDARDSLPEFEQRGWT